MLRRKFLAFIGAAPVAASVSPAPESVKAVGNYTWHEGVMLNSTNPIDDDSVARAKSRLEAIKWSRENNYFGTEPGDYEHYHMRAEVKSMRSWSLVAKERINAERYVRKDREEAYDKAFEDLQRAIKKSMAPSWMHRWL